MVFSMPLFLLYSDPVGFGYWMGCSPKFFLQSAIIMSELGILYLSEEK